MPRVKGLKILLNVTNLISKPNILQSCSQTQRSMWPLDQVLVQWRVDNSICTKKIVNLYPFHNL